MGEVGWRNAAVAFELAREVALVAEAAVESNGSRGQALAQQSPRVLHPDAANILVRRDADLAAEGRNQPVQA